MKKDFGGISGNIDYADMGKKRDTGANSGNDIGRMGGRTKTKGIGTTSKGSGYEGTIKDDTFNQVADASGWDH